MTDPNEHVMELMFGRWRSQILYAGVELGVFEVVSETPTHAVEIAEQLDIDREKGYRLLRALGALGLLAEANDRRFSITPAGELLQADHSMSMRGVALLEEGPTHYAVWNHLPDIIREGGPNGFQREFGHSVFDHRRADPDYAARFNESMTSLSRMESQWVAAILGDTGMVGFDHVCDVGGGHGHLLCTLLQDPPDVEGTVLELASVVEEDDRHWHDQLGVSDRVEFVAGDFFEAVPSADAYLLKHILHDWNDEECVEILSTIRDAAAPDARLFTCELVVPGPDDPHLAKLFDVHMLVTSTGRERTEAEYAALYEHAGFDLVETHQDAEIPMSVLEARAV